MLYHFVDSFVAKFFMLEMLRLDQSTSTSV